MAVERISLRECHARMGAQGVPNNHVAFRCPACGTVQSMASLVRAGVPENEVASVVGFSCEGRWTGAGAAPAASDTSPRAAARRSVRGCDWTLGGLFRIHALEVHFPSGGVRMRFALASPEEAQALRSRIEEAA